MSIMQKTVDLLGEGFVKQFGTLIAGIVIARTAYLWKLVWTKAKDPKTRSFVVRFLVSLIKPFGVAVAPYLIAISFRYSSSIGAKYSWWMAFGFLFAANMGTVYFQELLHRRMERDKWELEALRKNNVLSEDALQRVNRLVDVKEYDKQLMVVTLLAMQRQTEAIEDSLYRPRPFIFSNKDTIFQLLLISMMAWVDLLLMVMKA